MNEQPETRLNKNWGDRSSSKALFTWGGGPQVGEVTRLGGVTRLAI